GSTAYSTSPRTPRTSGKAGGAACTSSHRCCSRIETDLFKQNHMKTHLTLLALLAASFSAPGADVTGTWKAEFNTQRGLQKYTFTLKQDGANVTGKASVERDAEKRQAELKEGKVEGDTVTFDEPLRIQDNDIQITYRGRISGDEIRFTRKVGDFGSSE